MSMVCRATGTYTAFLSKLCTSPNINIWSKWKPVSLAKTAGLTAADLASVNYGFQINSGNTALFTTYWDAILNAAKDADGWYYKRPYGTSASPYRLGDYRNYLPEAVPFWDRGIAKTATTESAINLQVAVNNTASAEIKPLDFNNITDSNKNRWYYIAVIRQTGGAAEAYISTDCPLWFSGDYNEDVTAYVQLAGSTIKHYECCMALGLYDSENDIITDAILIPNSYREITYNPNFTPFDLAVNYDYDPLFPSTSTSEYCSAFTYRFDVLNVPSGVTNFRLVVKVKDSSADIMSSTWSAATLTDTLITGTCSGNSFYIGTDPTLDIYRVYATLSYTYQGTTRNKNFDFTNEVVSAQAAYESGVDFYTQYCVSHS